jgi:hypothetical protein
LDSPRLDETQHFLPEGIHWTSGKILPSLRRLLYQVSGSTAILL